MLYNTYGKIHVVAKGLTMHGDHDASTWLMISCSTKVAHSPLISLNSTWEYVFLFIYHQTEIK